MSIVGDTQDKCINNAGVWGIVIVWVVLGIVIVWGGIGYCDCMGWYGVL